VQNRLNLGLLLSDDGKSDYSDGSNDAVSTLATTVVIRAPKDEMACDKIVKFNVALSMGSVTARPDFPGCGEKLDNAHDAGKMEDTPIKQFENVKAQWEKPALGEKASVDAVYAWCNALNWKTDTGTSILKGARPVGLAGDLEKKYTEAPGSTLKAP